jgi:hypothetical protein
LKFNCIPGAPRKRKEAWCAASVGVFRAHLATRTGYRYPLQLQLAYSSILLSSRSEQTSPSAPHFHRGEPLAALALPAPPPASPPAPADPATYPARSTAASNATQRSRSLQAGSLLRVARAVQRVGCHAARACAHPPSTCIPAAAAAVCPAGVEMSARLHRREAWPNGAVHHNQEEHVDQGVRQGGAGAQAGGDIHGGGADGRTQWYRHGERTLTLAALGGVRRLCVVLLCIRSPKQQPLQPLGRWWAAVGKYPSFSYDAVQRCRTTEPHSSPRDQVALWNPAQGSAMDWLLRWHEHLGDRLPCAKWCRLTADRQRVASAHAGE